jgi:parvulin-like peptidyl-prolyl isomerase
VSLSQVATENGYATATTQFFGYNNPPPALFTVPDAADWALTADEGDVSPVFEGIDEFAIVQVAALREAGPAPQEDLVDQVRQLAEMTARVDNAKASADQIAAGLAGGQTLQQAGQVAGLAPFDVAGMTRQSPDARVAGSPEAIAALYAGPVGQISGPIRSLNGWYFVQVNGRTPANPDSFQTKKPLLTQQVLQQRQQAFLGGIALQMREEADVEDLRFRR